MVVGKSKERERGGKETLTWSSKRSFKARGGEGTHDECLELALHTLPRGIAYLDIIDVLGSLDPVGRQCTELLGLEEGRTKARGWSQSFREISEKLFDFPTPVSTTTAVDKHPKYRQPAAAVFLEW